MATETKTDSMKKLEASAADAVESLKTAYEQGRVTAEEKIRENPLAAVAGAAAFGFIFRFGVVRGLLGLTLRLALFSVKPLLIVAALMKVLDLMKDAAPAPADSPKRMKAVKSNTSKNLVDTPAETAAAH